MTDTILYEVASSTASLILNRPDKRNAFDEQMIQKLCHYLDEASKDPSIRQLVLCANGEHFSAGGDLNWMRKMASYTEAENLADAKALAELMYRLYHFSKPTLALVQGAVYGGGVGLVACCDTAIASSDASFCLSEVKLGLIPAVIGPYVMEAIGNRQAKHYMLTAEVFDAACAQRLGLVHHVVQSPAQLQNAGSLWEKKLLSSSPQALSVVKEFVHEMSTRPLDDGLIDLTAACIAKLRVSEEGQEGLSAFLEKRTPAWSLSHAD